LEFKWPTGVHRAVGSLFGFPVAALILILGVIVLLAAWVLHWLMIILGLILVVVGLYFLFTGGLGVI
jgi:hypothetical protein